VSKNQALELIFMHGVLRLRPCDPLSPGRWVTFIPETEVVAGLARVREELERRRRRVYLIHGSTYGT
jgi:hypothetical protein